VYDFAGALHDYGYYGFPACMRAYVLRGCLYVYVPSHI